MRFGPIAKLLRQVALPSIRLEEVAAWLSYLRCEIRARCRLATSPLSSKASLRGEPRARKKVADESGERLAQQSGMAPRGTGAAGQ